MNKDDGAVHERPVFTAGEDRLLDADPDDEQGDEELEDPRHGPGSVDAIVQLLPRVRERHVVDEEAVDGYEPEDLQDTKFCFHSLSQITDADALTIDVTMKKKNS